ncbi:MAG: toll/interleukin-1 receptor domain-containing protein [Pseudomonadota bacterium]|nr:toll/interleukin-1 receptor domain-containing protein [Pseudomonadota bacterium]
MYNLLSQGLQEQRLPNIFVSYAHVDNKPFSGEEKGWVTHFVNNLRNEVNRKMGREENYSLWMDFRLKGSDELTPELEKQVSQADTLLLFLSPGWLASKWCRRELEIFTGAPAKQHSGQVFVVEADSLETTRKPEVLRDCLGYRLWEKTDEDRIRKLGYPVPRPDWQEHSKYFTRLFDLSQDLANRLQDIAGDAPATTPGTKATVYVAYSRTRFWLTARSP